MKKILLLLLFMPFFGISQNSLFQHDLANSIIATKDANNTIGLEINELMYKKILRDSAESFRLQLPFFNQDIEFDLELFDISNNNWKLDDLIPSVLEANKQCKQLQHQSS